MILRIEDSKWIQSFPTYFIILQDIHKLFFDLMMCGIDDFEKAEKIIYLLSVQISRIVPLYCKKGTSNKELKHNDGILQLKKYIDFLFEDYENLFENCKNGLLILSEIRNKYEHEPHNITAIRYIIGEKEQSIAFIYEKYDRIFLETYSEDVQQKIKDGKIKLEWEINTTEIGKIILQLNGIFRKLQVKYIETSKDYKELSTYQVYKKIIDINFEKLNESILFYIN